MLSRRFLPVVMGFTLLFTGAVPALAVPAGGASPAKYEVSTQKNNNKLQKKVTKKTTNKKTTNKKTTNKKTTNKNKPPSRSNSGFDADKIIRYAMDLRGVPYRSGGTTPKGFDCSGFTMYVFKNSVGIDLPHSSAAQAAMGQALKRDELVAGALVYFNTSGSGVSHVGIYIGDDKFIDSSNSKGVAINSLQDNYWGSRYMGATLVK